MLIFNQVIVHIQRLNWEPSHITILLALSSFQGTLLVSNESPSNWMWCKLWVTWKLEKDSWDWILVFVCIIFGFKTCIFNKEKKKGIKY